MKIDPKAFLEAGMVFLAGLLVVLLLSGPASAHIGICPDGSAPPCAIGTLPTPHLMGNINITFDPENWTYMRYWFNYSTPYDFPWGPVAFSLTLPFVMQIGSWFFAIIWFLYLAMLYMRQQDPIGVFVIGIPLGLGVRGLLPTGNLPGGHPDLCRERGGDPHADYEGAEVTMDDYIFILKGSVRAGTVKEFIKKARVDVMDGKTKRFMHRAITIEDMRRKLGEI